MKIIIIFIAILLKHTFIYGQNPIFKQTNRIMEYNYGIIDSVGMTKMSEIEKIKYEFKYVEKSYSKTINQNFETEFEVIIDSNDYQKEWMDLTRKFKYTGNGMELYSKTGELIKTIPYTAEQITNRNSMKEYIQNNGYHPGIIGFPEFNQEVIAQFALQNITVQNLPNGVVKITNANKTTTYNKQNLTITNEYTDNEGIKNKETKGYEPYLVNKGYLLKIKKHERFVYSVNGPCITETKLAYYNDYNIQDFSNLIGKSLEKPELVTLYPNPNDGVFTATAKLNENHSITEVNIINVLTGTSVKISNNNQNTFLVNVPYLNTGQYVLQVITSNQKSLTVNFFKQ
jgi:hypothetical protein